MSDTQPTIAVDPAASPRVVGQWGPVFDLENVAIHAHLLPTGKVLYWGRRAVVGDPSFASLNEHRCSTFLWDPTTGHSRAVAQAPTLAGGEGVNLFCSGHSFLPDGRLLVIGGHLFDSEGIDQACVYDPVAETWTALPRLNNGRWYPSALTLPDGGVLAISGSFAPGRPQPPPDNLIPPPADMMFPNNPNSEIWRGASWVPTVNFMGLQLFPRLHIEPKQGRVFMAGPDGPAFFLDTTGGGTWTPGPLRAAGLRDYAPSVMFESGKVIFIGGGQDDQTQLPTNLVETIDLNDPDPQWKSAASMHFRRRQHNATVLPDGSVLVTGGTQGIPGNPRWLAFDNVRAGGPVHQAELWDPATDTWTLMAEESVDRCYHSTALLLPDGRVLSAGGGEYAPHDPAFPDQPNPPGDSHKDAQLFTPPYLLKGPRPTLSNAPAETVFGEAFDVTVGIDEKIAKVSWIRLGSVTHSCNQNQLLTFLQFRQDSQTVTISAPASANIAPPGHYMLFVLNEEGVPSIGHIARISAGAAAPLLHVASPTGTSAAAPVTVDIAELDERIAREQGRPPAIVGITPGCPYQGCLNGALNSLQQLGGVAAVSPQLGGAHVTAKVYLQEGVLPDLAVWRSQLAKIVNGSYFIRGIEMTFTGTVTEHLGALTLSSATTGPNLPLGRLEAADIVQWDVKTRHTRPMSDEEAGAFDRLADAVKANAAGATVQVTGPLMQHGEAYSLEVRKFAIEADQPDEPPGQQGQTSLTGLNTMTQNDEQSEPPPAARHPANARAVSSAFSNHGKPQRGLMSTPKSPAFQGRFGRMFRSLPAATYGATDAESRKALMALGDAMTSGFDGPKDGFDNEESGIPALYTYFGQFVDHDITFDPMTMLMQHNDPDGITDFRTPALDLDNVYGRGPGDQPYMYDEGGKKFLLGDLLSNGAPDLARNNGNPRRALIGDPRNDENSIVSQFQALMLRFHNRVVDEHSELDFHSMQKIVRWHYQWVVVNDFLPRLVTSTVLKSLMTGDRYDQKNLKFYHFKSDPFMPVEFAVAAYRLGHSMIRPGYRLNNDDATLLPIFPIPDTIPDVPKGGISPGLTGFQAMDKNRGIDWGRFIDIGEPREYGEDPENVKPATNDMKNRLQFAYRIDTSVVAPLSSLPTSVAQDKPPSLPQRNLLRGFDLGLPTGQSIARAMGLVPLCDKEISIGKAVDEPAGDDLRGTIDSLPELAAFKGKCPLWTYILAEAATTKISVDVPVKPKLTVSTPQLGSVGGRIVAEVFLGMLFGDNDSYLSSDPAWKPTLRKAGVQFALRDIVAYALGHPDPSVQSK